uniref:15-oxoprostaglandin 13-reductase n=1 Tax=Neogobius melanostomus TaxID=47308 RepID=A0A8C6WHI1_9GOBI
MIYLCIPFSHICFCNQSKIKKKNKASGFGAEQLSKILKCSLLWVSVKTMNYDIIFVGINASDINYSAGRYDPTVKPPFDAGFEGIGEVVGLGLGASSDYTIGDTVAYFRNGAFAEYTIAPAKECIRVPLVKPEFLTLLVSGATAYIALKRLGDLTKGETVLVTAAAGGTGQFAVQFAKQAGCHVIGTCSTNEKAGFLKSIGCDRPINYKEENLGETLRKEYPKGIDVVYESIGGSILDVAVNCLAQKGRLIVIGFISGYQSASGIPAFKGATLPVKLLQKSPVTLFCNKKTQNISGPPTHLKVFETWCHYTSMLLALSSTLSPINI